MEQYQMDRPNSWQSGPCRVQIYAKLLTHNDCVNMSNSVSSLWHKSAKLGHGVMAGAHLSRSNSWGEVSGINIQKVCL